jgi:hypothetical protein
MIKDFHKFSISEDDGYKENTVIKKRDTGQSSKDSYFIFLTETLNCIAEMVNIISQYDNNITKNISEQEYNLGKSLKKDKNSHKKLWDELLKIGSVLISKKPTTNPVDQIVDKYKESLKELEDQEKSGKLSPEKAIENKKALHDEANKHLKDGKSVFYKKAPNALLHYNEAIITFAKGASIEIDNMEKEKEDKDNKHNRLSDVTFAVSNILTKNK